ncbi:MAG TPA: VWA domain-containing protein [Thermoanaerobaculia bacterium]|nr:VWA domain-containing protein [Thermoanaerobaculia bacterium]
MKKLSLIALLALFSGAAAAQQSPGLEPKAPNQNLPAFRESVEVHVMDLDVVVTDSHGNPVPDLNKEDFTVRIDNKPVPLDYFTRVQEGTIHAPDLNTASPDRVLAEYHKGPDAYVPRHFLIYFDLGQLSLGGRKRGLEALRDLITRMGPNDSGRIVSFDRRPRTLSEWTTSKEDLLASLDKIESAGVAQSRLITEMQTLRDIDTTVSRRSRAFLAHSYGEQERAEVVKLLKDMNSELSTLTALDGKKSFLFVTGGFDIQPGSTMVQYAVGQFSLSQFDVQSVAPDLQSVVRRANASDITFYTVDARGLTAEGTTASADDPLLVRPSVAFFARTSTQAPLLELATQTGGLALLNSNDFARGISQVYQDTSTYYSIGVTLSKVPGSGYRNVKVEVARPGLTVRTRHGYAPRSAGERATDVAQAALRSNVEYRAIPVTMMVAPARKAKKYFELPIKLNIPASSLTFVPDGETAKAVADVYIAVSDDKGNMSDVGHEQAVFTMPKDAPAEAELAYTAALTIRKGNARVAINIQDRESGKMGTAKADVRVE